MREDSITLEMLGWNPDWEKAFAPFREKGFEPGRVVIEDKHYYIAATANGSLSAQVAGKVLHQAESTSELPKVGDWVALAIFPDEDKAVIHHILPRRTRLSRKVAGREVEEQVLVSNIDRAFIVQALDRTFNLRLLERCLVMVLEGGVQPVVVLNKADIGEDMDARLEAARRVAGEAPVQIACALTGKGVDQLLRFISTGSTVVFIGTSGVGKSSLVNCLYGEEVQPTGEVRESDSKGRHVTTWRELILLPDGGMVIDTPGVREFHVWMAGEGLHEAFPDIEELALACHFRNCGHTAEKRCAVLEAVADGRITRERYQNYLKLKDEFEELDRARRYSRPEKRHQSQIAARPPRRRKR